MTDSPVTDEVRHLTTGQVARRLGVHVNTVLALIEDGEFPNAFRLTREFRIPKADVLDFEKRRRDAMPKQAS